LRALPAARRGYWSREDEEPPAPVRRLPGLARAEQRREEGGSSCPSGMSHNLWPFELGIAAFVGGAAALAGAMIGSALLLLSCGGRPSRR
jgi:hypothetical protein